MQKNRRSIWNREKRNWLLKACIIVERPRIWNYIWINKGNRLRTSISGPNPISVQKEWLWWIDEASLGGCKGIQIGEIRSQDDYENRALYQGNA